MLEAYSKIIFLSEKLSHTSETYVLNPIYHLNTLWEIFLNEIIKSEKLKGYVLIPET